MRDLAVLPVTKWNYRLSLVGVCRLHYKFLIVHTSSATRGNTFYSSTKSHGDINRDSVAFSSESMQTTSSSGTDFMPPL